MIFLKALILVALIAMVFSPKMFFEWLDKQLFQEDPPEESPHFTSEGHSIQMEPYGLELEEKRLKNFDLMIRRANTKDQKRMWEVKKAEFLRNIKWTRLVEFSGASERF